MESKPKINCFASAKLFALTILLIILFSANGSAHYWLKTNVPPPFDTNHWLDVFFLDSDRDYGWVCGHSGLTLRTTDGGLNWEGSKIDSAQHMESIHFVNRNVGYCSGVEGIFKSTDGGKTWRDVTPDTSRTYWGCYFVNENTGLVLGGMGCVNNRQRFYRTSDGGNTWDYYEAYEVSTGLTDLILYDENGLGYAASSGMLWKTTDGGRTWSVFSNTGTNVWAEEITHKGNSFLVPYAGTTCAGNNGAGPGGTRFTTDNGSSWHHTEMGRSMYGTCLIDGQKGWACGDNRAIFYTSDAGRNWEMKDCGITSGHLDDVFFLDENTGWVVGLMGVYKLMPDKHTVSRNNFDFGEYCLPNSGELSFWIANYSFDQTEVHLQKFDDADGAYSIEDPDTLFNIGPCDSVRVTIKFKPLSEGIKTAKYRVKFDGNEEFILNLEGIGMISKAQVNDTLLVINPAYCGKDNSDSLMWTTLSPFNEYISVIKPVEGTYKNKVLRDPPIHLSTKEEAMVFSINPPDTGWYKTRFQVTFMPCRVDTFITVESYGVSPIITAEQEKIMLLECKPYLIDTIPVFNTGNDTLLISNILVLDNADHFKIIGWTSGYLNFTRIPPKDGDSLIVRFLPDEMNEYNTVIRLINNDKTTERGNMDPFDIEVRADYSGTRVFTNDTLVDFGEICLGSSVEKEIIFENDGDQAAFIQYPEDFSSSYSTARDQTYFPVLLQAQHAVDITLRFHPPDAGYFLDTLYFHSLPCFEKTAVIVKGKALETALDAAPSEIIDTINTNETLTKDIKVTSSGNAPAVISRIELNPDNPNWDFTFSPALPVTLEPGADQIFTINLTSAVEGFLNSNICFYTDSTCESELCIPVDIKNRARLFDVYPDTLKFDFQICEKQKDIKEIVITNLGVAYDTIVDISVLPPDAPFTILNMPALPKAFKENENFTLQVEYFPANEGIHSAEILLRSYMPGGQEIRIPLSGEFRTVSTTPAERTVNYIDYEPCAGDERTELIYKNSASLDDTLFVLRKADFSGLESVPDDYLAVPAGGEAVFYIDFSPSEFNKPGSYRDTFLLESSVCGSVHEIFVNIVIVRPLLDIEPESVDFGSVWLGDIAYDTVFIENNTAFDKVITDVSALPNDDMLSFSVNLPMPVNAGSKTNIPLQFFAKAEGNFNYNIAVTEISVCTDTTNIPVSALVPEEIYNIAVKIGDYEAKPGDDIIVTLELLDSTQRVNPTAVYYEIDFDEELFKPYAVSLPSRYGSRILPFNYSFGKLSGEIPLPEAHVILEKPGALLDITGTVFFSIPDTTGLIIKDFRPETDKNVTVAKKHGFLDLIDYCMPFDFQTIPGYDVELRNTPAASGELQLEITSEGSQILTAVIHNAAGAEIKTASFNLKKGLNIHSAGISALSAGAYFISFTSEYNIHKTKRFIIIK